MGTHGALREPLVLRAQRDDRVDLDRRTQRQDRHADRCAGMAARFSEHVEHQFGRAIGDLRLIGEIGGRIDERAEPDDALHPVERDARAFQLRKNHQPARPRGGDATLAQMLFGVKEGNGGLGSLLCIGAAEPFTQVR